MGVVFIPTRFSAACLSYHTVLHILFSLQRNFEPYPFLKFPTYHPESSLGTTFWILHEMFLCETFPDFLYKFPSLTVFPFSMGFYCLSQLD